MPKTSKRVFHESSSDEDSDLNEEILALMGTQPSKGRKKRAIGDDSDDEEEEASYQDASDEEESEEEDDDDDQSTDENWGDDLMGDEQDRMRLSKMSEMEREAVLYERSVQRQKRIERQQLKSRLERRAALRKVSARRSTRASTRRRNYDDHEKYSKKRRAASSDDEDYDEGEVEEVVSTNNTNHTKVPSLAIKETANEPKMTLDHVHQVQIKRAQIEKWIHLPFFKDLVKDTFARVYIGQRDGQPVYRMVEVMHLCDYHRPYKLTPVITIQQAFSLRYVNSERVWRLDAISNSPITEREFNRWNIERNRQDLSPFHASYVKDKIVAFQDAETYTVTHSDVNAMVKAKQAMGKSHKNAAYKATLLQEKEYAKTAENHDEVAKIDAHLAAYDERSAIQADQRNANLKAWASLNERNREKNISRGREVARAEMTRKRKEWTRWRDDPEAQKREQSTDAFHRRKCKPSQPLVLKNRKNVEGSDAITAHTPKPTPSKTKVSQQELLAKVHASVDIDIDIDMSSVPMLHRPSIDSTHKKGKA